jgi:hypothetical protein
LSALLLLLLRLIGAGILIYIFPKYLPNMSPWLKSISWIVGCCVGLWAIIEAAKGYWGMYQEYGPGVKAVAHHWLAEVAHPSNAFDGYHRGDHCRGWFLFMGKVRSGERAFSK